MMRFSRDEMVLYRWKFRSKTSNVAEVNVEKVEGGVKAFRVITEKSIRSGDIVVPSSEWDSEAWFGVPIFHLNFDLEVKGVCVANACNFVLRTRVVFRRQGLSVPLSCEIKGNVQRNDN
ncbi:hypothetical protein E2C01_033984 [Portunus trituberculatus]|uniref:Uncharacterized protein n=1 Tax=Portunus trituberculatus TaxID=210409 RepID=A0A5B7F4W4_PORTR|nr:hypothetical protein [Portunus trituberculatus]